MYKKLTPQERQDKALRIYHQNIQKVNGCWIWTGDTGSNGTPRIKIGKDSQAFYPRFISLELAGKTHIQGKQVKPLVCKNKACVNPDHLVNDDDARFWAKVQIPTDPNACWLWQGSLKPKVNGYGNFKIIDPITGKRIWFQATAYSLRLAGSPVPNDKLVCHHCDNPPCVNPSHLFIGTHDDNNQDKVNKGRQCRGEDVGDAILTEVFVKEIRERFAKGETKASLGRAYGVHPNTISAVVIRRTWKHVV